MVKSTGVLFSFKFNRLVINKNLESYCWLKTVVDMSCDIIHELYLPNCNSQKLWLKNMVVVAWFFHILIFMSAFILHKNYSSFIISFFQFSLFLCNMQCPKQTMKDNTYSGHFVGSFIEDLLCAGATKIDANVSKIFKLF